MLAAIIICGATVLTSCVDTTDNPVTENVIAYKGIPFVGEQPVGEHRWKAPIDIVPDDGIYCI